MQFSRIKRSGFRFRFCYRKLLGVKGGEYVLFLVAKEVYVAYSELSLYMKLRSEMRGDC